ncbi:EAL domain-containing protein [Aquibium sp. A9E412]|uniref:sensor domain-containing protein n=1 Tax=Aquibium sp. A9E412 TaxID=2976767 RepID=UPI0025B05777|nr:EAL domain-containing protein [Aquibium sp. A9E412]MDN2565780.1 EAL domain-containing protein [Aquibium sp. A9E412]
MELEAPTREAIQQREQLLEALTDAVPGFVWVVEKNGRVLYVNAEWRDYTGKSDAGSLGHGWLEALHPDDRPAIDQAIAKVVEKGLQQHELAARIRRSDGVYRWHLLRARIIDASAGLWIGCSIDIHERVERENCEKREHQILEMVSRGAAIEEVLATLCRYGEHSVSGARCSIMLVDADAGRFTGAIAPSLPPELFADVAGLKIGTGVGSCGTAAHQCCDVIVTDTDISPLWQEWRHLIERHSLRACWSRPVLSSQGKVLATFGFYFDEVRAPTADELESLEGIRHIASLAIERSITLQNLKESEEHHRQTVELNPQVPWTADARGRLESISSRWASFTGITPDEALGMGWLKALHPDDVDPALDYWRERLETGKPADLRYRIQLVDGSYRWVRVRGAPRFDANGNIIRWYGSLEDVHDHFLAEEQLRRAAFEDSLTGVANRRSFERALRNHLAPAKRQPVGLLLLDLDDFKQVNDRFGHAAGDAVLRLFARHLSKHTQSSELAARLGGDEFAVIVPEAGDLRRLEERARRLARSLSASLRRSAKARTCDVSVGCALAAATDTAEDLLKKADMALYESKAEQRNVVKAFVPQMRRVAEQKVAQLELGREALREGWIVPFYQPKVMLPNGRIVGCEALLRIDHPERGVLPPLEIFQALDHPKLGWAIGERMLSLVLKDIQTFASRTGTSPQVAVNLSAATLMQGDFTRWLLRTLKQADVPAELLTLEITERVLLDEMEDSLGEALAELRRMGMGIALDDFGTGYASLMHLQKYPISEIKIDHSFMDNLAQNGSNTAIVQSMITLGRNLGLNVVAEGVQSSEQGLLLRTWGCQMGQGFHYGRPMSLEDAIESWQRQIDDPGERRHHGSG